MTVFNRRLDLKSRLAQRSAFLFGPRGTGKSTWIRKSLPEARLYDLLDERTYLKLLQRPSILEEEWRVRPEAPIVIDEIQKLPKILDEVHRLISLHDARFLLTGSSARKLKRTGVNLLGGRARELHFFPLTSAEISQGENREGEVHGFDLNRYLNRGGLPLVYLSNEPLEDLRSYVSLYLREEIAAEALTRKVDEFARFLDVMAIHCGDELHYQNFSSDSGVKAKTLQNYIEILEDTLIGFKVPPFEKTIRRKAITRSKFYLFDIGITRVLARRGEVQPGSELFGRAFEHFIVLELRAALDLLGRDLPLQYWRTKSGFEVDLVLGDHVAIEIKGVPQVHDHHLKGLRALREENVVRHAWVVSLDSHRRRTADGIEIIPWQEFLKQLWSDQLF
jgi:predicted AAA+ superfamily ATPase